jgi:quinol monooxygenase YgiN
MVPEATEGAMWVKVRINAEERERRSGRRSERDEPCLRFNVLHDGQDRNVYYFLQVYRDEAAF